MTTKQDDWPICVATNLAVYRVIWFGEEMRRAVVEDRYLCLFSKMIILFPLFSKTIILFSKMIILFGKMIPLFSKTIILFSKTIILFRNTIHPPLVVIDATNNCLLNKH